MEEKDPIELSIEKRKEEIQEFREQRELFYANLNDEEKVDFLVNMYKSNEELIKELNLNTISEDDIK